MIMDNVDKKLKQNILTICQQDFVTVFELCGFSKYHVIYLFNIFDHIIVQIFLVFLWSKFWIFVHSATGGSKE